MRELRLKNVVVHFIRKVRWKVEPVYAVLFRKGMVLLKAKFGRSVCVCTISSEKVDSVMGKGATCTSDHEHC